MNIIVENYFNKFIKEQDINGNDRDSNFEKFINYVCFVSQNISNFNLSSICVGAGNDAGLDGIAIAVNNRFISDMSELSSILELKIEFDVEIFFVQAKVSESFECKEIANFGAGATDMFRREEEIKKPMNDRVKTKYLMIREIIHNYEYIKSKKCTLFYITPGNYVEDDNLTATKARIEENIVSLDLFEKEDVSIVIGDKTFIRKQYEKTKLQNSATFQLNSKIDLPYVHKVDEAYFAIMPIREYLKIVVDENNRIRRGIFELNVRDFTGIEDNRVNQDIAATLDSDTKSSFGLLNNGITIVGKSLNKGQGKYTIKNFYIVNGCQTTNVLYENKEKINDDMWISVKIVITQDDSIITNIVKATNNQTEVEEIQLLSMDEYQGELESYYNSYDEYTRLYYERRVGQYRGILEDNLNKIINPEIQMKSFSAIFLKAPHLSSRFIGKLQDEISKKIFVKDQRLIMYYTAGLLNYRIERAFNNDVISGDYYKFKYHFQMIISELVWNGDKRPQDNSYKMDDYCKKLIIKIEDEESFLELINMAKQYIDKVIKNTSDTEANKTMAVVNELLLCIKTGWTDKELRKGVYFNRMIEDYLIPFKNMSIDGDMRYNFNKNFYYLKSLVIDSEVATILLEEDFLEKIERDVVEDDRFSRRDNSNLLCKEIGRVRSIIKERINVAKRYKAR